jgi:hypothetical protein
MDVKKETITITFGECAENHVGMEQLGKRATSGIEIQDLQDFKEVFIRNGFECQLLDLNAKLPADTEAEQAAILVIRNGAEAFGVNADDLYQKLRNVHWDSTMYSAKHGGEVNKLARHNMCVANYRQAADIANKKGTVHSFEDLPELGEMKRLLEASFAGRFSFFAEGNRYYDVSKCGIGYHGDTERKVVVALRLGASMKLVYKWFHQTVQIGKATILELHHGDVYLMSEKATGWDWKKSSKLTLRHAAGCKKYTGED